MKRVLITSAGGAPAINFARSLRDAPEPFHLIGVDANKYTMQRAETDESFLVPRASDPAYLAVLNDILEESSVDFLHCQMSYEMLTVSSLRGDLRTKTFLPDHEVIDVCEDKFKSYERWSKAGIPTPETMLLHGEEDLRSAFERFGSKVWLREIRGSAGRGALPTSDLEEARQWIDRRNGWGVFTAAKHLEPQTITWQSLWKDGQLVVAQGRKRLYWEFANRAPSGVTGVTGSGVTVSDPELDALAERAVRAVDSRPNGIFGVDLTYDSDGVPNVTEINIGRFFTTHYFFTAAGLNFPYIYVKLGCGETLDLPKRRVNPLDPDLVWVRGMDCHPVLTTVSEIDAAEELLQARIARLNQAP